MDFGGVATLLTCEIEEMLGETIFVRVIVVEVATPRGGGTPVFGGTAFSGPPLDSGVLGRLVWGPWLLPYDTFSPFQPAATATPGFPVATIGFGPNWLPAWALEGGPAAAVGVDGVATVLPGEFEEVLDEAVLVPVTVAVDAEPCVEGTPLIGDTLFWVACPVLNVPVVLWDFFSETL